MRSATSRLGWAAVLLIGASFILGYVGELIHTSLDPCTGLLGYGENYLPWCFHKDFYTPDFLLLTFFSLLVAGLALTAWAIWQEWGFQSDS